MQPCTRIYYYVLLIAQHVSKDTAHHQELKTVNCKTKAFKPEAAITVFELLMMSVMSLEIC